MSTAKDGQLDKLDRQIVEKLSQDARISNRAIAAELSVTEGTIRARIKRLQAARLIQFAVVTDFRMAGSPNLCMIGVDAIPQKVPQLAQRLADMREIGCVVTLLGRYNILAMALFTSIEQLHDVSKRIRSFAGVQAVETSVSIHNLKYEAGIAKITRGAE